MPRLLLPLLLLGCSSTIPRWAIDPIHLVPDGSSVRGTQTWQLYSKPWTKKFDARHYVCSAVFDVQGTATANDCPDCLAAFDVQTTQTDTDCSPIFAERSTFTNLRRVGFGPLDASGPYPESSSVGYVDYGNGWEVHGWAFVAGVDVGAVEDGGAWNGLDAFVLEPTLVWDLSVATETPVSGSRLSGSDMGEP